MKAIGAETHEQSTDTRKGKGGKKRGGKKTYKGYRERQKKYGARG